jgi:hypothetical protein
MLNQFTDQKGRAWRVVVNFGTVSRVKKATGFDIRRILDPQSEALTKLAEDVGLMFDVLCAVLAEPMKAAGVNADDLGDAMTAAEIDAATKALVFGVVEFKPAKEAAELRKLFQAMFDDAERRATKSLAEIAKVLDGPEFAASLAKAVEAA